MADNSAPPASFDPAPDTRQEQAAKPTPVPTGNQYLSQAEVALLSESDSLVNDPAFQERQVLYNYVCDQFSRFELNATPQDPSEVSSVSSVDGSEHEEPLVTEPYIGKYPFDNPNATVLPSIEMPYNNTAIPPSEEVTGTTALPLARIKRILAMDEDISACSANAAFAITIATECFIRYLAEQSMNVVKSERKPRRNIQYKDVANAVARIDNLEFLADVVPKTTTYREFKQQKAARAARKQELLQAGQTTLDGSGPSAAAPTELMETEDQDQDQDQDRDEEVANGHTDTQDGPADANGNADISSRHYQANGDQPADESHDVEMG